MRQLLLVALLLSMGCGGPSYNDALLRYDLEMREYERLDAEHKDAARLVDASTAHSQEMYTKAKQMLANCSKRLEAQQKRVQEAYKAKEAAH